MNNVLVTGATGFLGQALTRRLHQDGFRVTAIGRNQAIGAKLASQGIIFECLDLKDLEALKPIVGRQNFIFHAAALTKSYGHYQDFYDSNVLATHNLIQACLSSSVERFVHLSTPSIYMTHQDRLNILEDDKLPIRFINHYASTKKLAEDEIDWACAQGIPCVTLRPQAIFGPGDQTLFPRILKLAQRGYYPVMGRKPVLLDLTYIDNVVDAAMKAMISREALGLKINITNDEPCHLKIWLRELFAQLGIQVKPLRLPYKATYALAKILEAFWTATARTGEPPITSYSVCALGQSRTLNIDRAKAVLGYRPRVSLEEGLQKFCLFAQTSCLKF